MNIKVYLDDERSTPEGWERAYTVEQVKQLILQHPTNTVSHLSLDNDLGENEPQGFTALDWLEEYVYEHPDFPVPIITIHSANTARAQSMRQTAAKLELIRQQQIGEHPHEKEEKCH